MLNKAPAAAQEQTGIGPCFFQDGWVFSLYGDLQGPYASQSACEAARAQHFPDTATPTVTSTPTARPTRSPVQRSTPTATSTAGIPVPVQEDVPTATPTATLMSAPVQRTTTPTPTPVLSAITDASTGSQHGVMECLPNHAGRPLAICPNGGVYLFGAPSYEMIPVVDGILVVSSYADGKPYVFILRGDEVEIIHW
ncbi:MAG: hypothetical protein OXF54_11065 [Caldilineaceae bacterium]|nr:hypothetical protein [Caldilineaceae bacterium]